MIWLQPGNNQFSGTKNGIDLLRIAGGQIVEVWLFSSDPAQEDASGVEGSLWGADAIRSPRLPSARSDLWGGFQNNMA